MSIDEGLARKRGERNLEDDSGWLIIRSSFSPLSYIFQKAVCEEFANCFLSFIQFYVLLPRIALTKVTRLWYNIKRVYYIFVAKAFFLRYDGDTDKEEIYG